LCLSCFVFFGDRIRMTSHSLAQHCEVNVPISRKKYKTIKLLAEKQQAIKKTTKIAQRL
jgi:hypothetical protein